jgi:iron-sulfur cluster assembly protein
MSLITITEAAAQQIRQSLPPGADGMALRLAARKNQDGGIEYLMGLDEPVESDARSEGHGVTVVVAQDSAELLRGTTLDYVEIEPGVQRFIFLNPNDPNFVPPGGNRA